MEEIWESPLSPTPQTVTTSDAATPSLPPEENGASIAVIPSPSPIPEENGASVTVTPSPTPTPEQNGAKRPISTLARFETPKEGKRKRSPYWAHYDRILKDGQQKGICKYCSKQIGCDPKSGTSALKNHIERCKEFPFKSTLVRTPELRAPEVRPPELQAPDQCSPQAAVPVVTWDMFPEARSLQQMVETMDRLSHDPFAHGSSTWPLISGAQNSGYRSGRTPWAIRETETSFKIRFDLPGLTRNDVKVWVEENTLVIKAAKVPNGNRDSEVYIVDGKVVEDDEWPVASYGNYNSRITLPDTVHAEKIKAEVKDGVLYVTVPKLRARYQKIEIDVQ